VRGGEGRKDEEDPHYPSLRAVCTLDCRSEQERGSRARRCGRDEKGCEGRQTEAEAESEPSGTGHGTASRSDGESQVRELAPRWVPAPTVGKVWPNLDEESETAGSVQNKG